MTARPSFCHSFSCRTLLLPLVIITLLNHSNASRSEMPEAVKAAAEGEPLVTESLATSALERLEAGEAK